MNGRNEPWLAAALNDAFKDPAKMRLYRCESRTAIANTYINRVFDRFDFLLPEAELNLLAKVYFTFLRSIKNFANDEGETADLDEHQALLAHNLIQSIVNVGILELLEGPKQIRKDLVKVLNWNDLTSKIDQISLLSAYLGGLFGIIAFKFPKSIADLSPARQCADKYINANGYKIIIETLLQRNYLTRAEAAAALNDQTTKRENILKSPAVIAGATIFSIGALAALAFGIFAAATSYYRRGTQDEKRQPAPKRF